MCAGSHMHTWHDCGLTNDLRRACLCVCTCAYKDKQYHQKPNRCNENTFAFYIPWWKSGFQVLKFLPIASTAWPAAIRVCQLLLLKYLHNWCCNIGHVNFKTCQWGHQLCATILTICPVANRSQYVLQVPRLRGEHFPDLFGSCLPHGVSRSLVQEDPQPLQPATGGRMGKQWELEPHWGPCHWRWTDDGWSRSSKRSASYRDMSCRLRFWSLYWRFYDDNRAGEDVVQFCSYQR